MCERMLRCTAPEPGICHNLISIHFKIHQLLISSFIQSQTFSEDDLIQRKISAKNREKRRQKMGAPLHHAATLLGRVIRRAVNIGVSGSFFRGGQQLHPAKIQSLPTKISSCQVGPCVIPSYSAKLFCKAVLPNCSANGQIGR